MRSGSWLLSATLATGFGLPALPSPLLAQEPNPTPHAAVSEVPPDAPHPQFAVASLSLPSEKAQAGQQSTPGSVPAQPGTGQESSSSESSTRTNAGKQDRAQQQIKEQEKQRVLGVLPSFNVSYRSDAVSLTRTQKINLAFHSATDPVAFATALLIAGYREANDDDSGFGWGAQGYGKRAGAAYLDTFDGTMLGNGILPALLHQDPRYFRLGYGTTRHRLLYALATSVICKHDNTGKWEPNYSNVIGNIGAGAISNLYYPSDNSGAGQAITNGLTVTAEGTLGALLQEFWPDISRHFFHKDPTHGLDAEARAAHRTGRDAK